jgi:hypothetical protein
VCVCVCVGRLPFSIAGQFLVFFVICIIFIQLLMLKLKKKGGGRMSLGCSQTLIKKVGVACPQGALTNYEKRWGTHVPRVFSKMPKNGGGRMSLGCFQTLNFAPSPRTSL